MKNIYIFGIILLICISCKAAKTSEKPEMISVEEYGKPLIVLLETDPWSMMVVGSDTPSFVLYDNGLLIYSEIINKISVLKGASFSYRSKYRNKL